VAPSLCDAAVLEHDDLIAFADAADAMRDADHGSPREHLVEASASARASAVRWRCPPESITPRSPTTVASPWGNSARSLESCARSTACATRFESTSGKPKAMFSARVIENRKESCGTIAMCERNIRSFSRLTSIPSMNRQPSSTSSKRGISAASVLLPEPTGPTMPSVVPAGTVSETLRSAGSRPRDP